MWKDNVQCNLDIFIVYFIAGSLAYTILLTFLPSIIEAVKNLIAARKSSDEEVEAEQDRVDEDVKSDNISIKTRVDDVDEAIPMSAYVTNVFFFIQLASLIHIDVPKAREEKSDGGSEIQKTLFNIFNFR